MKKPSKSLQARTPAESALKMMGDRILIVPSDEDGERSTRAGLLIPATANNDRRLRWGQVISVGPNARHVSSGDRVLFALETGYEVEIGGEEYLILRERDIQAAAENGDSSEPGYYL